MRIARLALARFGHLSDVALEFPAEARLHVVLGANEAGKSTALAAIGDALFGFPLRSPHGFLHANSELRIDMDLEAHGRRRSFTRLKRGRDDLRDEAGNPLPESAIEAFRGSTDRKSFERMFGLSGAALRTGGQEILEGKGELGSTIFQTSSGLQGVPAAALRLRAKAEELYTPRRVASRQFYQMADGFRQAKQDRDARSLGADSHDQKRKEHDRLSKELEADAAREKTLGAERRRLERIRRTAPHLREREQARVEMLSLGDVAKLPDDAEIVREQAVMLRQTEKDAAARDGKRRADLAATLAALTPDVKLLEHAAAIDEIARNAAKIEAARADRVKQDIVASQHERAIEFCTHELNAQGTASDVVARMPPALARQALRRGVTDNAALVPRAAAARAAREAAVVELARCEAAAAALEPADDPAPLRRALDAVKAEGRLDAELFRARDARDAAVREASRALSALSGWTGDAARLAATPVPSPAAMREGAAAMGKSAEALRDCERDAARAAHDAAAADGLLAKIARGGALPTRAAILDLRERRDRVWRMIRRHRIDGGLAPTADEIAGVGAASSDALPGEFEALLHNADDLVDRGASEAKRVAEFDAATEARERAARALDAADAARAAALLASEKALAAWNALWTETGISAGDPDAMKEWLLARKAVLDALGRREAAELALSDIERRHASAQAALSVWLSVDEGGTLSALIEKAESLWSSRDSAFRAMLDANLALTQARAAADKSERAVSEMAAALEGWRDAWRAAVSPFGFSQDLAPGDAETAIGLWERIAGEATKWRAALDRVAEMTAEIDAFDQAVETARRMAAPDLTGGDVRATAGALVRRLGETRAAEAERARAAAEIARLDEALAKTVERQAAAASRLAALCALAGVSDDADLAHAIERARRHARLAADVERCERELTQQGDGIDLATLAADADGADPDSLAARVEEIDRTVAELRERHRADARALAEAEAELARMAKGSDAVEAAQRMEGFAAEAAEIAGRYARLRLAGELLRAGLDRYRQQQQDPLLKRAGEHFSSLTGGRYERLDVDEGDDGKQAIAAVRADGMRCPVAALSEGARDQLYLALRTAAIEAHAASSDPMPFIADDLLVHFDDARALAGLRVLSALGATTQTILFTHHQHLADMVAPDLGMVHRMPPP